MGRPKKRPEESQGEPVTVRFQQEVLDAIRRACAVTQIGQSTFIRAAVLKELYSGGFWKPAGEKDRTKG